MTDGHSHDDPVPAAQRLRQAGKAFLNRHLSNLQNFAKYIANVINTEKKKFKNN